MLLRSPLRSGVGTVDGRLEHAVLTEGAHERGVVVVEGDGVLLHAPVDVDQHAEIQIVVGPRLTVGTVVPGARLEALVLLGERRPAHAGEARGRAHLQDDESHRIR